MTADHTDSPSPTGIDAASARTGPTTEAVVATVDDFEIGSMKLGKVGERRVVVVRTAGGFHSLDNACPHQGYGLATGSLDGELLTCQWHNWKFRVTDGECVIGEEAVACHRVRIDDDQVIVSVTEPTPEQRLAELWPSLQRGIERDYRGQVARDSARLLQAGATVEQILAAGLRHGLPRGEWGLGHDMAVSADLLELSDSFDGLARTLPLAHALSGIAESTRDRTARELPPLVAVEPDGSAFVQAIEVESESDAVQQIRSLFASTDHADAIEQAREWFVDAVSRHHYDYGHGAIFVQKSFQLIERIPEITELLLSEMARTLVYGTREDTLPYMRKAARSIDAVDLEALATAPGNSGDASADINTLVDSLLDSPEAPIDELVQAGLDGVGVIGILDAVSLAAAVRMLRFDLSIERDRSQEFGWLDITHALTYANAARWAWAGSPGPAAARLVLLTAFLVHDSGRAERRIGRLGLDLPDPHPTDLVAAVLEHRTSDAVAAALAGPMEVVADQLEAASLEDTAGSFIVMAHLVKTAVAARQESTAIGSLLPLAAAARFMASARAERFVTVGARQAIAFVETGRPPTR